jgi:DNA-binding HxlR family transcriptional regulator
MFHPLRPSSVMPFRVGDKWAGMVIRCLQDGPRRFGELRIPLKAVTPKVLSETCARWSATAWSPAPPTARNPPRVEHALTPLDRTLIPLLDAGRTWSETHLPALLAARRVAEDRS